MGEAHPGRGLLRCTATQFALFCNPWAKMVRTVNPSENTVVFRF
jgi:hypothetical protein